MVDLNSQDSGNENSSQGKRRFTKPNVSKASLVFLFSLILGAFGVFYSQQYIQEKIQHHTEHLNQPSKMVSVVVPNRPLTKGQTIHASELSLREFPQKYADTNSLTESNYEAAIGQRLGFNVDQGRPLLWAHLENGKSNTFSGNLPVGSRALTVRVDEINSISGFLQPGDRIDLLMTHGTGMEQSVYPLIQKLQIIATGIQTRVDKSGSQGKRVFNTITINVSPGEAKNITLAQKLGKLTAVLRNPEDLAAVSVLPVTTSQLFGKTSKPKTRPKPIKRKIRDKTPAVEYIIGGS